MAFSVSYGYGLRAAANDPRSDRQSNLGEAARITVVSGMLRNAINEKEADQTVNSIWDDMIVSWGFSKR
jgi:hypothetical protein